MTEPRTRAPVNLNRLAYFAAVVEAGSFTRAAERLGITKAVVSQQVAKLEQEVGCALLVRTTRSVRATDAGRALDARCSVILREAADGFDELAQRVAAPRGTLRIAAPLDYGTSIVVPVIAAFTQRYPACTVALALSDDKVDLQAIDLAIRVGWLADSSRQARRLGEFQQWLVCAPALARTAARLRDPDELHGLPFVANRALTEVRGWRFVSSAGAQRTVRLAPRVTIDATPAVHAAILAGAGVSVLPDYLVEADLAAGRLRRVLPDWHLRSGGIHAVFPSARLRPASVRAFLELLIASEDARRGRSRAHR
jgi:DNA-binding transcriptional LysR family regulator